MPCRIFTNGFAIGNPLIPVTASYHRYGALRGAGIRIMQCIIRAFAAKKTAVFAESKFKVTTLQEFYIQRFCNLWCNVFQN